MHSAILIATWTFLVDLDITSKELVKFTLRAHVDVYFGFYGPPKKTKQTYGKNFQVFQKIFFNDFG
jgi:hypothetical protein